MSTCALALVAAVAAGAPARHACPRHRSGGYPSYYVAGRRGCDPIAAGTIPIAAMHTSRYYYGTVFIAAYDKWSGALARLHPGVSSSGTALRAAEDGAQHLSGGRPSTRHQVHGRYTEWRARVCRADILMFRSLGRARKHENNHACTGQGPRPHRRGNKHSAGVLF